MIGDNKSDEKISEILYEIRAIHAFCVLNIIIWAIVLAIVVFKLIN
jgi:hypothetical protein